MRKVAFSIASTLGVAFSTQVLVWTRDPDEIKAAFKRALKEKPPVVIDIVSDIEVIAPLAWEKPE